ncbi:protein brambleberry [Cololabis saira]|uniref:protein brambleberry n=1 Tax=Cololabis saira TaxID=129043 RepID=UPI002AD21839|nr:protein brambleberry [Cololabis saira]
MAHVSVHVFILLSVCLACPSVSGLFEWLRQTPPPPEAGNPPEADAPAAPPAPPTAPPTDTPLLSAHAGFEVLTADEKFLAEAKQLQLSPLDGCHHRVVARLRSSCGNLSEEDLAKLGVELFNCQAETEGRQTFPCTGDMTLRACTAGMDADTWTSYHIVSNRARSVCYAVRQQLFRRRAELTVNALMHTASSQLDAMQDLKDGQQQLKALTSASLQQLLDGHQDLQAQQGRLHEGQGHVEASLRENLQRLGHEKALIASGQELVAQLIQGIASKMENVSERLQSQNSEVQDGHKAIVQDLTDVRLQAQDIHHKIDTSLLEFLQYQDRTAQYYADLMAKLERMNGTLGVMLRYMDATQTRVEERLALIQGYLGWAGLSLTAMWTCVAHAGYFVVGAVLLTFLRCPGFSRAALLLTVPLNAVAEVNQQPALDLAGLSLLLLATSLGHWFLTGLWSWVRPGGKPAAPLPIALVAVDQQEPESPQHRYPASSTPQREEKETVYDLLEKDDFLSGDFSVSAVSPPPRKLQDPRFLVSFNHSTPRFTAPPLFPGAPGDDVPTKMLGGVFDAVNDSHGFTCDSRSASPAPSVLSVLSNGSMSGRQLCNGLTKTGKACKKRAVLGQEFCRLHQPGPGLD